uniref:hypothetical protein n=1 Tax=Pseudomonas sp. TaxID=306 RepID=UPI0020D246F6|nr:hypothetical protein [Pseudomonas sp.]QDQ70578.1 hypothetical protein pJBCL41_00505 [Pseudomonas sp.]
MSVRISVESLSGCAWNGCPSQRGIRRDGWKEYLHSFGNILEPGVTFRDILCSRERMVYLRRQMRRNNNPECTSCEFRNACLLEFAKPNKPDDECFGAKRFVAHAIHRNGIDPRLSGHVQLY